MNYQQYFLRYFLATTQAGHLSPESRLYGYSLPEKFQHNPVLLQYLARKPEQRLICELVESVWAIILVLKGSTHQSQQHLALLSSAKANLLVFAKVIVNESRVDTRILASTLILLDRLKQKLLLNPQGLMCSGPGLLMVCVILTWKYLVDGPPFNKAWAECLKNQFDTHLILAIEQQVLKVLEYELGFDEALLLQRLQAVLSFPGAPQNHQRRGAMLTASHQRNQMAMFTLSSNEGGGIVARVLRAGTTPSSGQPTNELKTSKKLAERNGGPAPQSSRYGPEYNDYALRAHERRQYQAYLLKELLKEIN